jgi:hypothetical protein
MDNWKEDIDNNLESVIQQLNDRTYKGDRYMIIGEIITYCIKEFRHDILINNTYLAEKMIDCSIYLDVIPNLHFEIVQICLENSKHFKSEDIWRAIFLFKFDRVIELLDLFFDIYPQLDNKKLFDYIAYEIIYVKDHGIKLYIITEKLLQLGYQPSSRFITQIIDEREEDILQLFVDYNINIKKILMDNKQKTCSDNFIDLLCNQLDVNIIDYILL